MGINELILEGKALEEISDKTELEKQYNIWGGKLREYMKENDFSDKELEEIKVKMYYTENEYSENDSRMSLKRAIRDTVRFLQEKVSMSEKKLLEKEDLLLIESFGQFLYVLSFNV